MYTFDVQQQFGVAGPLLALCGTWFLARASPRRAALLILLFAVNVAFALGYNVGDTHVFLLPSHLIVALLAACGLVVLDGFTRVRGLVPLLSLVLIGARVYGDYPALDRSRDTRPTALLDTLTRGIDDRRTILISDLNWQVQNGLTYFAKHVRREIAHARLPDVMLYAPALINDNAAINRSVVLTAAAADSLARAYGPILSVHRDPDQPLATLAETVAALPPGTRYVLCVLTPVREFSIDRDDLRAAVRALTGGRLDDVPAGDYAAMAGATGAAPDVVTADRRPFRIDSSVNGVDVTVRMDSWIAFDTFRRMGFGHVITNRRHALIVERGISFVTVDDRGAPIRTAYRAGIFAPEPRYIVDGLTLRATLEK
jgi:hypothetical protein